MKGYLGRPEATAAMIDADGWLHTGDIGRVDDDGWLFVVDRVKELIKYKGYQVAPAELEALLLTHAGVADAAVIGVYDEDGNEVPKAFVVRQPGDGRSCAEDEVHGVRRRAGRPVQEGPARRVHRRVPRAASGRSCGANCGAGEGRAERPGATDGPRRGARAEHAATLVPTAAARARHHHPRRWTPRTTATPSPRASSASCATRWTDAGEDDGVRAVVLTHTGNTFCAGADLREAPPAARTPWSACCGRSSSCPSRSSPASPGMSGPAGSGCSAPATSRPPPRRRRFAFTEARIGVAPAVISLPLLPRARPARGRPLLPHRRALRRGRSRPDRPGDARRRRRGRGARPRARRAAQRLPAGPGRVETAAHG